MNNVALSHYQTSTRFRPTSWEDPGPCVHRPLEVRFEGLTAATLGPLHGRVACFLLETVLRPKFGEDHRFERTWDQQHQQTGYRTWVRSSSNAAMLAMQVRGLMIKVGAPVDAVRVVY